MTRIKTVSDAAAITTHIGGFGDGSVEFNQRFDALRDGVLSSARQLFGNYTFGGCSTTPTIDDTAPRGEPWTHGYETLGTLDSNNDGEISGEALNTLSLWFDANRAGVSDESEVVPAHTRDVQRIFSKDPTSSNTSRDVHLDRRFTRSVDE